MTPRAALLVVCTSLRGCHYEALGLDRTCPEEQFPVSGACGEGERRRISQDLCSVRCLAQAQLWETQIVALLRC